MIKWALLIIILALVLILYLFDEGFWTDEEKSICTGGVNCVNREFLDAHKKCTADDCIFSLRIFRPEIKSAVYFPRRNILSDVNADRHSILIERYNLQGPIFDWCGYLVLKSNEKTEYLINDCDPFWVEEFADKYGLADQVFLMLGTEFAQISEIVQLDRDTPISNRFSINPGGMVPLRLDE